MLKISCMKNNSHFLIFFCEILDAASVLYRWKGDNVPLPFLFLAWKWTLNIK